MSTTKSRRKGMVAAQRQADRRRGLMLASAAVAVLLLFAALIGYGLYRSQQAEDTGTAPPGATAQGVPIGNADAPVTIDLYEDFQCPVCKQFEQLTGPTIDQLIQQGTVRVIYHPLAFLNQMSSTKYSSRASAASGCAAAEGVYPEFAKQLFAQQPPEGGDGLPAETLIAVGRAAGAGPDFDNCVRQDTYAGWSTQLTEAASRAGVNGTPTVRIDGQDVADRTPAGLQAAVAAAQPH